MGDWIFFPLVALIAAALIALALVWPQGMGARSPGPFGHVTSAQVNGPNEPHPIKFAKLRGSTNLQRIEGFRGAQGSPPQDPGEASPTPDRR